METKTLIYLAGVSLLLLGCFIVYWVYFKPKYKQEKLKEPEQIEPTRVTPVGTSFIPQSQIKKLPRPTPATEQKPEQISLGTAVRQRSDPEESDQDPIKEFFSSSGFDADTEYPVERRE